MTEIIAFILGGLIALVIRKFITKQPLLKARVDRWVDEIAEKVKD